jgi:hypothetical protein
MKKKKKFSPRKSQTPTAKKNRYEAWMLTQRFKMLLKNSE